MHIRETIVEAVPPREETAGSSAPSWAELVLLHLLAAILFIFVLTRFQTYAVTVNGYGDNLSYLQAANAIRHWDFHGVSVKQFWGFPYLIACLSWLHLSARTNLLVICILSSVASGLLSWRLWGGWIAGYFAFLNFTWIQVSLLGGSEPLFVAVLLLSCWAIRKEQWLGASILAAFATTVRPLGVFALVGIAFTLVLGREYRKAILCTCVATLIGMLYVLPFWIYYHDPLLQWHQYKSFDWHSGPAINFPFRAIAVSFLNNPGPWTNVVFTLGWMIFALIGLFAMGRREFRRFIHHRPAEFIFAFLYLTFLFSYNSWWARADFPRFVLPVMPFLLFALDRWLPQSRYVVYGLGVVSPVLAACSAIGIRNVYHALH